MVEGLGAQRVNDVFAGEAQDSADDAEVCLVVVPEGSVWRTASTPRSQSNEGVMKGTATCSLLLCSIVSNSLREHKRLRDIGHDEAREVRLPENVRNHCTAEHI